MTAKVGSVCAFEMCRAVIKQKKQMNSFILLLCIAIFIVGLRLVRDTYMTRLDARKFDVVDDYSAMSESMHHN